MLKHFFKSTVRSLRKNKTFSILNIFGLATGIACAGLIFLWVEDELSFDQSYANRNYLYQVRTNQTYDGTTRTFLSSPSLLAEAMKREVPGIVNACRIQRMQSLFAYGEKAINEKGCYADSSVFSMFTPVFVQGNSASVFHHPKSVVITEGMAERFFGKNSNVIGRSLTMENRDDYRITGVIKNAPVNTTLQFDWLVPFEDYISGRPYLAKWGANSVNTYAQLAPGTDPDVINRQLYGFIQGKQNGANARAFLFAMKDWRLRDKFEGGIQTGGRIEYIRMFITIAWIVLLIACINFMNLSTARSEKRAREVGVRKVAGAERKGLVIYFIGEAMLMSFAAVLTGILFIVMALPFFNLLVEKQLTAGLSNPLHIAFALAIGIICGLVAGSYPAAYLSGFKPIQVLKGWKQKNGKAEWIRKGLVVLQFSVSIILIISTLVIYLQVQHIKNRDIGYNRHNLLSVQAKGDIIKNYEAIRHELITAGLANNAGLNSFNTMYIGNNSSAYDWEGKNKDQDILISHRDVSTDMLPTLGLTFLEGRNFSKDITADSTHVIISQSLARLMGKGTAIGKTIFDGSDAYSVTGVVNDFVYGDMYGQGDPVIYFPNPSTARFLYIRISNNTPVQQALAGMQDIFKKYNPAYPFEYSFVDDQFNDQFKGEALVGQISKVFAVLAVVISCLGLFGLAAYMAERRTKEIGIRKVLGASVTGIMALLSREFLYLVGISILLAYPLAWLIMSKWLQGYAYRIHLSWWIFGLAGTGALLIALVTVSSQSVKAALTNPVKSLRTE